MKQLFNFALIGAIALTSATMFVGCNSSEDAVETNNPNYNEKTREVTTQFVLNVATNTGENITRQGTSTVQKTPNFRGLKDAKLVGLSTGKSTWLAPFAGNSSEYAVKKTYDLGMLYGSSAITAANNETSSSHRILQLALPLNTDAMLVYARAIPGEIDEENGKVTMNITETPENSTFDLVSRLSGNSTRYEQACALGAAILNDILDAQVTGVVAGDFNHNGYTNVAALDPISWEDIADDYISSRTLAPLAEVLAKAYATLTKMNTGELRAGSGAALFDIAQALYHTASSVYDATATTDDEANAQRLAIEIRRRIGLYFNIDNNGNLTEWKSIGKATESNTIIYNLVQEGITTDFSQVKTGDVSGLPTVFGLPLGAAILYLDNDGNFTYRNPSTSLLDQNQTTLASHYMYPAELLYFDNSALRVNDKEKKAADYPNGVNPWDDGDSWTGWTDGAVTSSTRSVAVKNNINYGVAMLQTIVQLDGTSFQDNRHAIIPTEENQTFSADDVKKFKLTGVLIGGQNNQMGWNYLAKSNDPENWDYVIFDNKINGAGTIPTPSGEENYTLVFDNYYKGTGGGTQAEQTDVLVALEFENQSTDFYGQGNLVRYGGKFYLVGKLILGSNRIAEANWPTYYAIPPYVDGATNKISRIFVQDFMTTATFKINNTSLQKALVTVPDLRSSQTSLGLSVDIQWRDGLNFSNVILGQ